MKIEEILDYKLSKIMTSENLSNLKPEDKKFGLFQAKTVIQNYCHRKDIPNNLFYIWADMAIDTIAALNPSLFPNEDEENMGKVASVHDGDTTIQFSTSNNDPDTLKKIQDMLVTNWQYQLQSFRKIPRGCGCGLDGI